MSILLILEVITALILLTLLLFVNSVSPPRPSVSRYVYCFLADLFGKLSTFRILILFCLLLTLCCIYLTCSH